MRSRFPIIALSFFFALLTLIPYGIASGSAGDLRFSGFLFNPYDAASYLAKMREGYDGQILYTLAFTEDPGPGALIFPFYLLLGRLARLLQMPLIYMWQAARTLGAAVFSIVAWEFFGRIGLSPRGRSIAWIITALGSGFGFAAVMSGTFTADLWVAEYIPFLGMLTNAHFPLATGLILLLAMRIALPARRQTFFSLAVIFLLATALAAVQPFGFLPLGMALCIWIAWKRLSEGRFPEGTVAGMIAAGLGLAPWAAYDFWVTQTLPQFAAWFAQNQTPTPPVWDVALSVGLPGAIAAVCFVRWVLVPVPLREKIRSIRGETMLLGLWLAVNLALLYAPFSLQRRLMLGLWIPLAALAAPRIETWLYRPAFSIGRTLAAGIPLMLTNAVFLAAILANSLNHNPLFFLGRHEAAAVDWLDAHAHGSVVLAPPEWSLWLPGMAGVRVVYGHPMETPNAEWALRDVEAFFLPVERSAQLLILIDHRVNWILCSAEEQACKASAGGPLQEVFTSGAVKVLTMHN